MEGKFKKKKDDWIEEAEAITLTAQGQIFLPCTFGPFHWQIPENETTKQLKNINITNIYKEQDIE